MLPYYVGCRHIYMHIRTPDYKMWCHNSSCTIIDGNLSVINNDVVYTDRHLIVLIFATSIESASWVCTSRVARRLLFALHGFLSCGCRKTAVLCNRSIDLVRNVCARAFVCVVRNWKAVWSECKWPRNRLLTAAAADDGKEWTHQRRVMMMMMQYGINLRPLPVCRFDDVTWMDGRTRLEICLSSAAVCAEMKNSNILAAPSLRRQVDVHTGSTTLGHLTWNEDVMNSLG